MFPRPFALLLIILISGAAFANAEETPGNMGRGLRPLVEAYRASLAAGKPEPESVRRAVAASDRAQVDGRERVLVDVYLDGRAPLDQVRQKTEAGGATVTAVVGWYRKGLFSAWVPLSRVETLARTPGVSAVQLAPRRRLRIGAATSQGVVVHKTDLVNASGYLGAGVTVGVLSDSFDKDHFDSSDPGWTTAEDDVRTGDLPGVGNPNGYTTPVNVIEDGEFSDTDEGRAMLQIVHDVAPAADLAFCTTGNTDAEMVNNLARLKSEAGCKVICDDVGFDDEPMYSDGVIAQEINTLAGEGVSYFSAIGNDGNSGYQATFSGTSNAVGRARAAAEGINLASIPASESKVISQWHVFSTGTTGQPEVVQTISTGVASTTLIFQWDDPFDLVSNGTTGVTTDYDILVFNAAGNFAAGLSGTENNILTNEPIELPENNLNALTTYKICIVLTNRTNNSQPQAAHEFRYLASDGEDAIIGDDINLDNVSAVGHATAAGCSGVGAYIYDDAPDPGDISHTYTPLVDGYSSNGPVLIYFDSNGNRLTTPVTRNQPVFAGVDNVDTSFFPPYPSTPNPNDYDDDGFPNFAGTSAAAPHAAGIAALLMGAASAHSLGPLSSGSIQSLLIASTQGPMDQDPIFCSGTAGPIILSDSGDEDTLPNVFEITYTGSSGAKLTSVSIDLSSTVLHFDTGTFNGLKFTPSGATGSAPKPVAGKPVFSGGASGQAMMTIPFSNFKPGDTYKFAVGFDEDDTGLFGYDADELGGAAFSATLSGSAAATGTLTNQLSRSYNYKAGYGLLDAQAAINLLLGL